MNAVTLTDTPPTDTPPTAPTNLHTTANTASHVDLAWNASTDDHGVTGYKVFRGGTQIGAPTATSFSDTTVAGSQTYTYTVTAVDTANQQSPAASLLVTTPASIDTTPPTSTLNALPPLTGSVTVSAAASDNTGGSGVKKVDFYHSSAGGATCGATSTLIGTDTTGTSGTYSVSWNTATVTDGVYKVCSIATDNASLTQTTPSTLSGTVSNPDTVKPTVSVIAPAPSPSVITGKTVTLSATATDNSGGSGVKNVQFQVDGVNVGSPDTTPSGTTYSINWDSTTAASGSRIVTAVATDNANNAQTSAGVTINVVNSTTAVTAPGTGATVSGASVSLAAITSGANGQVTSLDFMLGGTVIASTTTKTAITGGFSWTTTWNSSTTANGAYNLTAVAKDNGVAVGASPAVAITVNNVTVTISITSPANNSSVSTASPVTISATTTGSGVTSVQFKDGSTSIGTDSTGPSPWSTSWDTAGLTVGSLHTLTAVAAGNGGTLATSSGVNVTIIDTTAPTAPTNVAASVVSSAQVNVTWSVASDNVGVTGYRVFRNGSATVLATVTGASFSDTSVQPTTSYFYTVKAIDAAGNVSAASAPSATVTTPCAGDCSAPSVPTNLSAVATAYNKVTLTWTASSDNVAVDHYVILRGGVVIGTSLTSSYADTTVSPSTAYSYVVKAQDAAGNVSVGSSVASVTTPSQPIVDKTAPSVPTGLAGSISTPNLIVLSWNASTDTGGSGLAGYNIYRGGSKIGTAGTAGTSFGDGTVSPGNTYSYTVTAFDAASPANESALSAAVSVTIPGVGEGVVVPVYRFYSSVYSNDHFYTISADERDAIIANYPGVWNYEGPTFNAYQPVSGACSAPEATIWRFYAPAFGNTHFFTANETEKDYVISSPSLNKYWIYEGVAFCGDQSSQSSNSPVYRFYAPAFNNTHFYTANEQEKDSLLNDNKWHYEGVSWFTPK